MVHRVCLRGGRRQEVCTRRSPSHSTTGTQSLAGLGPNGITCLTSDGTRITFRGREMCVCSESSCNQDDVCGRQGYHIRKASRKMSTHLHAST